MKTVVQEVVSYKIEMEMTQAEACALMAMMQNAHTEDEPAVASGVREHIFQALKRMGVTF
jgi:hypothetical protein